MNLSELNNPIIYEERLVVFFDVMGWRSKIVAAGDDPIKIGKLAVIPKLLKQSVLINGGNGPGALTSFSDCCVISIPFSPELVPHFLYQLSTIFVGAALEGFLLRAGVTVGKLNHVDDVVFGPALNRAYELECGGTYPRIMLDREIPTLNTPDIIADMVSQDDKGVFVNPFRLSFLKSEHCNKNEIPDERFWGIEVDKSKFLLAVLLGQLEKLLDETTHEKHRDQVNWLYLRIRNEFKNIFNS